MDYSSTPAGTLAGPGPGAALGSPRPLGRVLLPLTALILGACATASSSAELSAQPGMVQDANQAVSCPHGTVFAAGQTQGRLSAVWCEKPDGRRHGPYVEWWENHQKKGAGLYQDGVRHGVWTFFVQSGQRDSQVEYRNGTAVTSP